jgi:hypothetical protein
MRLDDQAPIRRLTHLLAAAALACNASCNFQPDGLSGDPADGGDSPDARGEIPDARVVDAGRMADAAAARDASPDAGGQINLTAGLVAYWPLDVIEGTSTLTTPDVVGGFDGEVRGTATMVPGNIDGALFLDGSSGFVRIANVPELDFTGIITLAAWCRPRAIDGFRMIVAHGTSFSPNGEVYLRLESDDYQAGSWTGGDHRAVSPVPATDVDTWVHIAGVYDGATWRLYRNGVEVGTGGDTGAVTVNEVWALGARSRSSVDRYFHGEIDDVRIYKRALSAAEILALTTLQPLIRR